MFVLLSKLKPFINLMEKQILDENKKKSCMRQKGVTGCRRTGEKRKF